MQSESMPSGSGIRHPYCPAHHHPAPLALRTTAPREWDPTEILPTRKEGRRGKDTFSISRSLLLPAHLSTESLGCEQSFFWAS
uniref:Uncharacterized protein n=1 Tax=Physcomitrium patens TaxID=3218 RepID=A0A2K1KVI5_PHYPA|nr:hypothetical protein PHYPA_004754 [Physcomitrium patens]